MKRKLKYLLSTLAVTATITPVVAIPLAVGKWNTKRIKVDETLKRNLLNDNSPLTGTAVNESSHEQLPGDSHIANAYEYVSGNYASRAAAESALEHDATYEYQFRGKDNNWYDDINIAANELVDGAISNSPKTKILYTGRFDDGSQLDATHVRSDVAYKVFQYDNKIYESQEAAFVDFKKIHGELYTTFETPENPMYGGAIPCSEIVKANTGWNIEYVKGNEIMPETDLIHTTYAYFQSPNKNVTPEYMTNEKKFGLVEGTAETVNGIRHVMGYIYWDFNKDEDHATTLSFSKRNVFVDHHRGDTNMVGVHFWTSNANAAANPYVLQNFTLPDRPINAPVLRKEYAISAMHGKWMYSPNSAATSTLDNIYENVADNVYIYDKHYFVMKDLISSYIRMNPENVVESRKKDYVIINGRKFKSLESAKAALIKAIES